MAPPSVEARLESPPEASEERPAAEIGAVAASSGGGVAGSSRKERRY